MYKSAQPEFEPWHDSDTIQALYRPRAQSGEDRLRDFWPTLDLDVQSLENQIKNVAASPIAYVWLQASWKVIKVHPIHFLCFDHKIPSISKAKKGVRQGTTGGINREGSYRDIPFHTNHSQSPPHFSYFHAIHFLCFDGKIPSISGAKRKFDRERIPFHANHS